MHISSGVLVVGNRYIAHQEQYIPHYKGFSGHWEGIHPSLIRNISVWVHSLSKIGIGHIGRGI